MSSSGTRRGRDDSGTSATERAALDERRIERIRSRMRCGYYDAAEVQAVVARTMLAAGIF